jgi:tetratricopeptide (TPR) repeat protein
MTRLLALAVTVAAFVADGDAARGDAKGEAQMHVDRASKLYDAKRYREALDELNTAYTLDPQPLVLYAIGQIHVALGQCDQAVMFYNRFLATGPGPDVAAATREAITACNRHQVPAAGSGGTSGDAGSAATPGGADSAGGAGSAASGGAAGSSDASATGSAVGALGDATAVTAEPRWYDDHVADAMVGGGVAALLFGLALYADAVGQANGAGSAGSYALAQSELDHADSNRAFAVGFAVIGAALVGVGIHHYVRHRHDHAITVAPAAEGVGLSWAGHF